MKRPLLFVAFAMLAAACAPPERPSATVLAQTPAQSSAPLPTTSHRFVKIVEGVYAALGTGRMNVGSNSAIIVNDRDVLIVDSHITPSAMRTLLEELKTITDKPVRYVVDSHYHYDHAHGNQVFGDDVQVIGHEFTRRMLFTNVLEQYTYKVAFADGLPGQLANLKKRLETETDPAAKARLQMQIESNVNVTEAIKEIKPTPPNITLTTSMTLFRGSREIRIMFFGRGHTGGDVVVYLPKERVLCSGDLITAGLSYMGDAFVNDWPASLEAMKALDFEHVIPGHGEPFTGKARIDAFQAYLRDLWNQTTKLHKEGVPAAQAAAQIDMTAHKAAFTNIQKPGIDQRTVERIYEVLDGKTE